MTKLFEPDPKHYKIGDDAEVTASFGERGNGQVYVWDEKTVFAVQVAQTTHRPLLLRGPAGSGKSSLAPFVANVLQVPFYSFTVNARSQARDMMWKFDALGRLNDANVANSDPEARKRVGNLHNYLRPGQLWWAFNRDTAELRGAKSAQELDVELAEDPSGVTSGDGAVVLIDEIDKADPDVPNNLLEALGSRQFTIEETDTKVADKHNPLVMITTNEERELPRAFLRRCIVLHLAAKTTSELSTIAQQHFGNGHAALYEKIAGVLDELRTEADKGGTRPPSTAEYLDAIDASIKLAVDPPDDTTVPEKWDHLIEVALRKRRESKDEQRSRTSKQPPAADD
jgi:MoxR-like ATPase